MESAEPGSGIDIRARAVTSRAWRLLRVGMLLAIVFGALAIFLSRSMRLGFAGIATTRLAQWLGGANVYVDECEALAHRREQKTFRPEWKLDLIDYVFNHLMVSVVLLFTTGFSEGLFGWAVDRDPADLSPRLR